MTRQETTRLPVRSALFKHDTGGLVVERVTIGESLLLYVFALFVRFSEPRKNCMGHVEVYNVILFTFLLLFYRVISSVIMNISKQLLCIDLYELSA